MKLLVLLLLPCLSLSEVVKDFAYCREFFWENKPPQFTPKNNKPPPPWFTSVQEICQCVRDNNKQQIYLYATLYNTDWRIPIYSAYVFKKSKDVGRCDYWYIEPQLDGYTEACMEAQGVKPLTNQAVNDDYKGSSNRGYQKGHLYPVKHTDNPLSMRATSTLTNAAPQNSTFNRGKWSQHEAAVIADLKDCKDKAYVVTGVVPHDTIKLNNRVTASRYYWRATCCLEYGEKINLTGKGYFGPDRTDWTVQELSITALQTKLATDYKMNIVIFTGGCY